MNIALITGSSGLIGGESVEFFSDKFDLIIGIDNNLRSYFSEWKDLLIGIVIVLPKRLEI